jgi:hypothetical protein
VQDEHEATDIGAGKGDDDDQQAKPSGVTVRKRVDHGRTEAHEHEVLSAYPGQKFYSRSVPIQSLQLHRIDVPL